MLYELLGGKNVRAGRGPLCGFLTAGDCAQRRFLFSCTAGTRRLAKQIPWGRVRDFGFP